MTDRVVVVGASGFGRECLDVLEAMQEEGIPIEVVGVVDDSPSDTNLSRLGERDIEYLGKLAWLQNADSEIQYILGIGNPAVRRKLVVALEATGRQAATAIHPSAVIGSGSQIGKGVVICAGVVISTRVKLGGHVHVNPNATIGHDTVLADFVSVNPASVISGEVHVAEGALVGAAAVVLQQRSIGADALIGAAALVTRDVPPSVVVKGVPGRWE